MRRCCSWWHWVALGAILLAGLFFRVHYLNGQSFSSLVSGDAREYCSLAEFFLDPETSPPGNRFPGFSIFLALLFSLLPYSHDAIVVCATMALSTGFPILCFILAFRLMGIYPALFVTAAVAMQFDLADSAHRGLSEELFLVSFYSLLLFFLYLRDRSEVPWWMYGIAGIMAGWAALVRPDAGYAAIPMFGMCFHREFKKSGFIHGFIKTWPIIVLPFLLPSAGQWYMESLGIQPLDMRVGRAGLWMEFMLGRMPYEYMFNTETHVRTWIFGNHSLPQLLAMALKSSMRNLLALGEALWGQCVLLMGIVGLVIYGWKRREFALPLAVPFVVLPQWVLVYLWPDSDVFRYNIRILPLLIIFVIFGIVELSDWLRRRIRIERLRAETIRFAVPIILSLAILSPNLVPFSVYAAVSPSLDGLRPFRKDYLPRARKVHPALVSTWDQLLQQRISLDEAEEEIDGLLAEHPAYAPTHFVRGLIALQKNKLDEAVQPLARALEIVPFFAEAGVVLAEVYALQGRKRDALRVLERMMRKRPDYSPLYLLKGNLHLAEKDYIRAREAFETSIRLNRYQHRRALTREARILKRRGGHDQVERVEKAMENLDTEEAGLITPFLWNYLGYDLNGLRLPKPLDQTFYYNLGLVYQLTGEPQEARKQWLAMVDLIPDHIGSRINLGLSYTQEKQFDEAENILQKGLRRQPDSIPLLEAMGKVAYGQGKTDQAVNVFERIIQLEPHNQLARETLASLGEGAEMKEKISWDFLPAEIFLPITRSRL